MDLDKILVYKKRGSIMKKSKKILITVAVILIAVGMICGFCGIYSLGFNFNEISTSDFVTHTYTVEDDFTNIIIEEAESNINFYKSNDDKCRVLCDEREKVTHTVVNENNTLTVRVKDERNWFVPKKAYPTPTGSHCIKFLLITCSNKHPFVTYIFKKVFCKFVWFYSFHTGSYLNDSNLYFKSLPLPDLPLR